MRRDKQTVALAVSMLLCLATGVAADPGLIPLQGALADAAGEPIDGSHRLTFVLFDAAVDGNALYTDDRASVDVNNGHFIVYLGDQQDAPLDLSLFRDERDLWLEVVIDGTEIVTPRTPMGSVPYAGYAQYCGDAESLGGLDAAGIQLSEAQVDGYVANNGYQSRIAGSCSPGSYVRAIADDGTVTCEADANTQRNINHADWFLQFGESATLSGYTSTNSVCFVGRVDMPSGGGKCQAYLSSTQWMAYTEGSVLCNIRCIRW